MFTGIITHRGKITQVTEGDQARRFVIQTDMPLATAQLGASIACSGVCLTATNITANTFTVEAAAETLAKTTVSGWALDTTLNLERSLSLGDELGGHLVFGHVDGLATLDDVTQEGEGWALTFSVAPEFVGFVAPKGSVSLDGISLTVNWTEGNRFGVLIIPHTWQVTTLASRKAGDQLNFEADMLARYVARQLALQVAQAA